MAKLKRDGWVWILDPQGVPSMELFPLFQYKFGDIVFQVVDIQNSHNIVEFIGDVEISATDSGGHSGSTKISYLGDEIIISQGVKPSPLDT